VDKKQRRKNWYNRNREHILEQQRKWRLEHPDYMKNYIKNWCNENKESWNKIIRRSMMKLRLKLFDILGHVCVRCGYDIDIRALQFDHINNNGKEERSKSSFLNYYTKHPEEARKKLQVLCANCNVLKEMDRKGFKLSL
jgi:hypothetical protein